MPYPSNEMIFGALREKLGSLPNVEIDDEQPVNENGGFTVVNQEVGCNVGVLIEGDKAVVAANFDDCFHLITGATFSSDSLVLMEVTHPNNPSRKHMIRAKKVVSADDTLLVYFQIHRCLFTPFRQNLCKMLVADIFEHAEEMARIPSFDEDGDVEMEHL